MRDQRAAPARAEGSGDATTAADRQSGDTTDDDVARAATAVVDDRPPAVSGFDYVDGELHDDFLRGRREVDHRQRRWGRRLGRWRRCGRRAGGKRENQRQDQ